MQIWPRSGAAGIPSHTEHHLGVIIDGPPQERVAFSDHRLDFETGDEVTRFSACDPMSPRSSTPALLGSVRQDACC